MGREGIRKDSDADKKGMPCTPQGEVASQGGSELTGTVGLLLGPYLLHNSYREAFLPYKDIQFHYTEWAWPASSNSMNDKKSWFSNSQVLSQSENFKQGVTIFEDTHLL